MVEILIAFILFIPLAYFSFYIPGKLLLYFLNLKLTRSQNEIASWFVGICLFLLISYVFAWLRIHHMVLLILLLGVFTIYLKNFRKLVIKDVWKRVDKIAAFIILLGSFGFLLTMFLSGWQTAEGIQFIGVNAQDGIRHTGYIKNMELFFPPQQAGLAGETWRGFHYFYDFLLSRFGLLYGFSVEDLNFRLFPLLISILYGAAFYFFASFMTKDVAKIRWVLLFAYFSQSSVFILQFPYTSLFWEQAQFSQPIGLLVNPFMVLAIGVLLCGLALIPQIEKSWKYALIVGLLLGVLSQIKVYTGLIGIFCVVAYPLYRFIVTKKFVSWKNYALAIGVTALLTAVTFLPNNYKAGGLVFAPFLFYREYMQRSLFSSFHWEIQRTIFAENNNILRIVMLYIQAFFTFWILNIGSRIILFARAGQIVKKTFWQNGYHILLLFAVLWPLILVSLFVQTVSVFDSVQFFWVIIPLLCIPSGIVMGYLWMRHGKFVRALLLALFILASYPGFMQFVQKYFSDNRAVISHNDLIVFRAVADAVPQDRYVLFLPEESDIDPEKTFSHKGTLRIAAMTGRSVYFEPGGIPGKSAEVYIERRAKLYKLHRAIVDCNEEKIFESLKEVGANHILTVNTYPCLATSSAVIKRVASDTMTFYQFK